MDTKSMKIKFENIFRSAEFKLTAFYFLIICAISAIFNIVIFTTMANGRMEISQTSAENYTTEKFRNAIIEARNAHAEQKIFEAMMILNFAIVALGSYGSWVMARKTLAPLEKAHKLQSEFVSNASHEIRTPLSTIQLETELILKDKNASKDQMREILESNLEEARSLTSLTEMLLNLSKIEDLPLEKINLNEIIRTRVEKFGDSDKINFEESKIFTAHGNETAIDELATILIDNALKYNTSKEKIDVRIFRSNRQAVFEVSNFSQELSKEQLDKMFERFYRADNVRSCNSKCEGHGLGLAIAKKLTENLNASLTVRNEKVIEPSKTSKKGKKSAKNSSKENSKSKERFKTTFRVGLDFEK